MDLLKIAKSAPAVKLGLGLGRLIPPRIGHSGGEFFADRFANRKSSSLVRTIQANQSVIRGGNLSSDELDQSVKEVLRHQARCYYDLYHTLNNRNDLLNLAPPSDASERMIALSQDPNFGAFLVAPHLSNFDLILLSTAFRGLQGQVLVYGQPTGGYDIHNQIRASTNLEITPVSEDTHQRAIDYMKMGGFAITAVDRPIRRKAHRLNFFGQPSPLPAGHIRMALAADVPVLVVAAFMREDGYYDLELSDPIPMEPHPDPSVEIQQNGEAVLRVIEGYIRKRPGQWLMYYPVWPEAIEEMN